MNNKQQEIKELSTQIKNLQNRLSKLQAEVDSKVDVRGWYKSFDSIFLVKNITNDRIIGLVVRDDGVEGVYMDMCDSWTHDSFNKVYEPSSEYEAKEIFCKYIQKLTDLFHKQISEN